jgi:BON domain-containing protein
MPTRHHVPFVPAFDTASRARHPGAVDIAPDDVSLLGPRRRAQVRSPEDLAMYGYAGQGYPLYGQPPSEGWQGGPDPRRGHERDPRERREMNAPEHPSFLRGGRDSAEHDRRQRRGDEMPWQSDPSSSAFAFGYTTSLGASHPPPSPRPGGHAGKGPRDYVRADSRVREDICDRLSDDDSVDASDISVDVKGGEVTLSGSVLDRFGKRRAEDIAAGVRGVVDVRNELRVRKGLLRELGAELVGDASAEHRGHHGEGPR